jgi:hypothetical protein
MCTPVTSSSPCRRKPQKWPQRPAQAAVSHAEKIVASDFRDLRAIGMLRLREHTLVQPNFDFATFLEVLHECFLKETRSA